MYNCLLAFHYYIYNEFTPFLPKFVLGVGNKLSSLNLSSFLCLGMWQKFNFLLEEMISPYIKFLDSVKAALWTEIDLSKVAKFIKSKSSRLLLSTDISENWNYEKFKHGHERYWWNFKSFLCLYHQYFNSIYMRREE